MKIEKFCVFLTSPRFGGEIRVRMDQWYNGSLLARFTTSYLVPPWITSMPRTRSKLPVPILVCLDLYLCYLDRW